MALVNLSECEFDERDTGLQRPSEKHRFSYSIVKLDILEAALLALV